MANSNRVKRLADNMQKILANLINREIKDSRISLVTLTEIDLSSDLSNAKVYFTAFQQEEFLQKNCEVILNNAAGFLRNLLMKEMTTKVIPKLHFHYDNSAKYGADINELITFALNDDKKHQNQQ